MNALQQKCRPKHQVLVLKCYPRTTKGAVDVKPNSSELSYLLYYVASRKSKFQKVGSFLEKKTASDVWRLRIGFVLFPISLCSLLLSFNLGLGGPSKYARTVLPRLAARTPTALVLFGWLCA